MQHNLAQANAASHGHEGGHGSFLRGVAQSDCILERHSGVGVESGEEGARLKERNISVGETEQRRRVRVKFRDTEKERTQIGKLQSLPFRHQQADSHSAG